MGLFREVEGDTAIIVENGVYKQVPVYNRNGYLYAKVSGGFIRLYVDGSTSKPKCRLSHLDTVIPLYADTMGRLCRGNVYSAKLLDESKKQILLGTSD
jgi:hypothetical protein